MFNIMVASLSMFRGLMFREPHGARMDGQESVGPGGVGTSGAELGWLREGVEISRYFGFGVGSQAVPV